MEQHALVCKKFREAYIHSRNSVIDTKDKRKEKDTLCVVSDVVYKQFETAFLRQVYKALWYAGFDSEIEEVICVLVCDLGPYGPRP